MRNIDGRFIKGNPGRPKGSANRYSSQRKQKINELLSAIEENHLDEDLKKLTPRDRTNLYRDLLEFVTPKLTRTERPPTEAEDLLSMTIEEINHERKQLEAELKNGN